MANRIQIQTALQKPYDRILFGKEVLSPVFGSCFNLISSAVPASVQPNKSEQAVIQSVSIYGTINLEDGTEITCYEINLQPSVRIEHSKVAIQHYVRKLLTAGQMALVNFISPQNNQVWRLTLVAKDSELTEQGIKEKTTHAKRYTYLLGPSETCKTAAIRFEWLSTESKLTFTKVREAFEVEKLSIEFIKEYTLHYQKFVEFLQDSYAARKAFNVNISNSATKEEKDKAYKPIRDFVKKLLGRIVFLYFVQKKGWLGASDTNYKDGLTDFIKQLFKQSGGNDAFYSTWLTVLFFETLNKERSHDDFKMPDGKNVKVPFLNGGLFDKEDHDEHNLTFNSILFHHPDFEDTLLTKKNRDNARGFLDFLDAFNFTVHEDSPDDHTVAVDPEMLGHIFENLLEDNKDKGTYYTPKEIVHYMCQESLTEYLTTHLSKEYTVYKEIGNAQVELFGNETQTGQLKMVEQLGDKALNRDDVAYIVKHKDISHLTNAQLKKIDALLDTVKICDPAIGSGAFPMGLLQEIYTIKEVIAYQLQQPWKPADVKENIIQNSVYGVDIEKGAVDIARLRFWLSLVVDEERPRALPNLDYKIVVGDSLVSKFEGEIIEIDWGRKTFDAINDATKRIEKNEIERHELLKIIAEKQKKFFKPDNKDKKELQAEIRNLKLELLINQLSFNKEIYESKNKIVFDSGLGLTAKEKAKNLEVEQKIKEFKRVITKLQKLKQNKEEPFVHFDYKLDFPEVLNPHLVNGNAGFDIVIGNPPYINISNLRPEEYRLYLRSKFRSAKNKSDIYSFFFEKGFAILKRNAVLTYIIPQTWKATDSFSKLREIIFKEMSLSNVVDLDFGTFDAVVKPMIVLISNETGKYPTISIRNKFFEITGVIELSEILKDETLSLNTNLSTQQKELFKIIENNSERLDVAIQFSRGIKTSDDTRFIHKSAKNNDYKKVYRGKNIRSYQINWNGEYIWYRPDLMRDKVGSVSYSKEFFEVPEKIVTQRVNSSMQLLSAYDNLQNYFLDTTNVSRYETWDKKTSLKFICALLNSKVLNFWYCNKYLMPTIGLYELHSIPIKRISKGEQLKFITIVDFIIFLKSREPENPSDQLIPTYFEQIIDGMVYELYFPELIKKHKREIIQHLGDLPEFTDKMSEEQKMKICKTVFNRLNDREHPVRVNLFYMSSIPEIAIIEGKNENN